MSVWLIVTVGTVVLLGLAIVIGGWHRAARATAWSRIGEKHRALVALEHALQEQRRQLLEWESAPADETGRRQEP